jgi:hypothetical protein
MAYVIGFRSLPLFPIREEDLDGILPSRLSDLFDWLAHSLRNNVGDGRHLADEEGQHCMNRRIFQLTSAGSFRPLIP